MVEIRGTASVWIIMLALAGQSQLAVSGECTPHTPRFCPDGGTTLRTGDRQSASQVWGDWGITRFESDQPMAGFDTDRPNVSASFETNLAEALATGLKVGVGDQPMDLDFNASGSDATGWTLSPYATWLINDWLSVGSSFSYSWLDYEQQRFDGLAGGRSGADFDAERWQLALNLNASWESANWLISAQAGVRRAAQDQAPYTQAGALDTQGLIDRRTLLLTQGSLGIEAAHLGSNFESFLGLTYRSDLSRSLGASGVPGAADWSVSDDDDEFEARLGVRLFEPSGFSLRAELARVFNREDFDSTSILFTLQSEL